MSKSKALDKLPRGRFEERLRAVFFLPVGSRDEVAAMEDVVNYLDSLDSPELEKLGVKGYTRSSTQPFAFRGRWDSKEEQVVMFIVDYLATLSDEFSRPSQLYDVIMDAYEANDCKQEEVWVTCHHVTRFFRSQPQKNKSKK